MKFTVAVVVLTLAVAAQASIIPLGWAAAGHGWAGAHDDGQWHGDHQWDDGSWDGSHDGLGWGGAHAWSTHSVVAHPGAIVVGHGLLAAHGPALVHGYGHGPVVAHAHGHGHGASYVAANRGSVHVAPLAGHIQSVSSSNTAPAPGTNW